MSFLLVACGSPTPSENSIQTAIAETQTAKPTSTVITEPVESPDTSSQVCISEELQAELTGIENRFEDAIDFSENNQRFNLSLILMELQEIRRETQQMVVPSCLNLSHGYLLDYMDHTIDAFASFLAEEPLVVSKLIKADIALSDYYFTIGDIYIKEGLAAGSIRTARDDEIVLEVESYVMGKNVTYFVTNNHNVDLKYVYLRIIPGWKDTENEALIHGFFLEIPQSETVSLYFQRSPAELKESYPYNLVSVKVHQAYVDIEP